MANEAGKLFTARAKHAAAQKNSGGAPATDATLDESRKDRGYNPIDGAQRASISQKLNEDAAQYREPIKGE